MLRRCGWNEKKCKQFTLYKEKGNVDKTIDPAPFFFLKWNSNMKTFLSDLSYVSCDEAGYSELFPYRP
jgi:hypothetical protein